MTQLSPIRGADEGGHLLAIRNALVLLASLAGTWSVALVVRMLLPRVLGRFGQFSFADTFTTTVGVFLILGMDVYVLKEIPARPKHAREIRGGTLALRVLLAALLLFAQDAIVRASGKPSEVRAAVLIFGLAQLATINANTFASLLHAARTVDRLAVLNVVAKVLWAGAMLVALHFGARLELVALAYLLSESARAALLWVVAKERLELDLRLDWPATKRALRAALPFYLNAAAVVVYARIGVSIMALRVSDEEVGYYSAAWGVAGITMMLTPLFSAVLMPQLSRAEARSREELMEMFRRSSELLVVLAVPISLSMGLAADVVVALIFGAAYAPAVLALQLLAPMFALTYLAMLAATCLVLTGRGWTTTAVSFGSIVINASLNATLLRAGVARFGPGGGGITAATIAVVTELGVVCVLLSLIGRSALDRKSALVTLQCLLGCAVACGAHVVLAPLGPARVLLDTAAYALVTLTTGAVKPIEIAATLRSALRTRSAAA